jgi:CRISPR-associated endonuclease Csy4
MNHFVEIKLLPDPEFVSTVLMSALFSKLHRALVEVDTCGIGISCPDIEQAQIGLGERLRLHGTYDNLQQLMEVNWLTGMRDHSAVGEPTPIPSNSLYRVVRRVQAKSSPERLRRRLARRKNITMEEARQLITDRDARYLSLPFVSVRSQSTGQIFRLFIEHKPPQPNQTLGEFSRYGLSATATVPWF